MKKRFLSLALFLGAGAAYLAATPTPQPAGTETPQVDEAGGATSPPSNTIHATTIRDRIMNDNTVKLDQDNFQREILEHEGTALVDFWADWCAPCRAIAPTVEELAAEFDGRATVGKVHVDEQEALARRFEVRSIPTMLLFRNGEVADRVVGRASKARLAQKLEALAS